MGCALVCGAATVEAREDSPPSGPDLEFLEFLGSWETEDGQWVNPLDLMDQSFSDVEGMPTQVEGMATQNDPSDRNRGSSVPDGDLGQTTEGDPFPESNPQPKREGS